MAKFTMNMADGNLIKSVLEADGLRARVPRMNTFFEGIRDMKVIETNSAHGLFTKKSGFTPCRTMQYMGTVTPAILAMVYEVDQEFWNSSEKIAWFFRNFPEYDIRTEEK